MKRILQKIIISLIVVLTLVTLPVITNVKAMSYNYDFFKKVIPSAEGLSYEITYYSNTIKDNNGTNNAIPMDGLKDMEVYNNKIYIINSSSVESTKIVLHNETVNEDGEKVAEIATSATNISKLIVLNEDFKWEKIINEFPFCQDVIYTENGIDVTVEDALVKSLNDFYGFKTPLSGITVAQFTSTEQLTKAPYVPYTDDNTRYALRLKSAEGITVTKDGIYIADTDNNRIVQLNFNFEVVNVYLTPDDTSFYQVSSGQTVEELAGKSTQFRPTKVAVDVSGRVYCIAKDIYEGIIEFAKAKETTRIGSFNRFLGKNEVVANPLKAFWTKIFSEAQLSSLSLDLPPMFTNITMDSEGFLYATSLPDKDAEVGTTQANMVKAINTAGKDVMKRNGYVKPNGDATYVISSTEKEVILGPSTLVGVAIDNKMGIFTTVDSKRGRLFTYDMEGNLLYITGEQPGGSSTQAGGSMSYSIAVPVAVDYFNRDYIDENGKEVDEQLVLVLDSYSKSIIVYKTTEFGKYVNKATSCYQKGEVEEAEEYWREVVKINTNYELAYLGIGKSLLRKATSINEYKEAMSYFEEAHNAVYYSKAYSLYRDEVLKKNFSWIMTTILVVVVGVIGIKVYKFVKNKKANPNTSEGGDE